MATSIPNLENRMVRIRPLLDKHQELMRLAEFLQQMVFKPRWTHGRVLWLHAEAEKLEELVAAIVGEK